ncbi:MAG TPA: hypothetical protein VNV37_02380 [Solirubrobacteraceae bacterium]|jgi:hypothetical protein|nr:hypothetical protein [Solirubrobacteraceae bacterium]
MSRPRLVGALLAGGLLCAPTLFAGCGSDGGPAPSSGAAALTEAAPVSVAARGCPAAALEGLEEVARRIYAESASGRIVAQALWRVRSSSALAQATEDDDAAAAHRALEGLLLNQIVSVRVTRDGRTLAVIERGAGIGPQSGALANARGQTVGEVTVAVQGANGYAQTVNGLLHAQVIVRGGGRRPTATLRPPPTVASGARALRYRGGAYRVASFAGAAFPSDPLRSSQPLRVVLLAPEHSIAAICAHGGATGAQAQADALGAVAERVYAAERAGSKAELLRNYVEGSRPFREAVLAGDAKATRAAIVGFFRSHLHIVRVRVLRHGKLLVDVGGHRVLAPIPGVVRDAQGRVAAHFLLAIQDDLGLQLLAHTFTGAQVVMREGARQVMGTLKPSPATIPDRGRLVYRGVTYQVYSFPAEAFPSGPLRISLLFAVG